MSSQNIETVYEVRHQSCGRLKFRAKSAVEAKELFLKQFGVEINPKELLVKEIKQERYVLPENQPEPKPKKAEKPEK